MTILAVVLCTNLVSCSDDDDSNGNGNSSGKGMKISTIIWNADEQRYDEYSYDEQGRIIKLESYDEGVFYEQTTYEYNADNIVITSTSGNEKPHRTVCQLNTHGLIVKVYDEEDSYDSSTCGYDADGQLISINEGGSTQTHLTWENGNLTKATEEDSGGSYTNNISYTYNQSLSSSQGLVHLDDILIDIVPGPLAIEPLANSGYFGKIPQNLLSGITSDDGYDVKTESISYELSNGYVSKITLTRGADILDVVTLTWK